MKFGYCTNMIATDPAGAGMALASSLQEEGFDYVEFPLAQMMTLGEEEFFSSALPAFRSLHFPCLCCNNFFPATLPLTGEAANQKEILEYAKAALTRVEALGAHKLVFGSSGARNVPAGFSQETAKKQFASLLGPLGDLANSHGVTLVMEPLNRLESNLLNSVSEGLQLVLSVAHPNVRLLMDSFHMDLSGEPFTVLRKDTTHTLFHVHVARTLGRTLPCAGDEIDWTFLFSLLKEMGYQDTISVESYLKKEQGPRNRQEALSYLRTLWKEA